MSAKTVEITQHIPLRHAAAGLHGADNHRRPGTVVVAAYRRHHIQHGRARVGGAYDIRSIAAGIGARGEFIALEAFSRLSFTWNWMNDGISTVKESRHSS